MGLIQLTAADEHLLDAYESLPVGTPKGGLVILQEVFGVTAHMRDMADRYAAAGYHCVVPALFDRVEQGIVLDYAEVDRGRELMGLIHRQELIEDVAAAGTHVSGSHEVAAIGYCWGGTVAWIAASTLPLVAAVSYYGARIHQHLDLRPECPMQFHFGDEDAAIPLERIEEVRAALPEAEIHHYPTGHGFNCTDRRDYHAGCARLAMARSLVFLGRHMGRKTGAST